MIKNDDGQSTIEFILAFGFVFGFLVTFIKLSLNYTNGYLVHYATFMSARTFMVVDTNDLDNSNAAYAKAQQEARSVFQNYKLDQFLGSSLEINFRSPAEISSQGETLFVGAYADFQGSFSLPFARSNKTNDFRSEALLGKEPVRAECKEQICRNFARIGVDVDCNSFNSMSFDNGC